MKKFLLILAAVMTLGITLFAQTRTGSRAAKAYDLQGFNAIEVSGDFKVNVNQGPYNVMLDVPEELESYLKVFVKDGELKIYYNNPPMKIKRLLEREDYISIAKISLPDVEEIEVSGASRLVAKGLRAANLSIDCSGASRFDLDGEFGRLGIDCSGASKGVVIGKAKIAELDASGASSIDALELVARKAVMDASGASKSTVNAVDRLEIDCSGASSARYKVEENTIVRVESSGASSIKRL